VFNSGTTRNWKSNGGGVQDIIESGLRPEHYKDMRKNTMAILKGIVDHNPSVKTPSKDADKSEDTLDDGMGLDDDGDKKVDEKDNENLEEFYETVLSTLRDGATLSGKSANDSIQNVKDDLKLLIGKLKNIGIIESTDDVVKMINDTPELKGLVSDNTDEDFNLKLAELLLYGEVLAKDDRADNIIYDRTLEEGIDMASISKTDFFKIIDEKYKGEISKGLREEIRLVIDHDAEEFASRDKVDVTGDTVTVPENGNIHDVPENVDPPADGQTKPPVGIKPNNPISNQNELPEAQGYTWITYAPESSNMSQQEIHAMKEDILYGDGAFKGKTTFTMHIANAREIEDMKLSLSTDSLHDVIYIKARNNDSGKEIVLVTFPYQSSDIGKGEQHKNIPLQNMAQKLHSSISDGKGLDITDEFIKHISREMSTLSKASITAIPEDQRSLNSAVMTLQQLREQAKSVGVHVSERIYLKKDKKSKKGNNIERGTPVVYYSSDRNAIIA
jgi:hypothetical protein